VAKRSEAAKGAWKYRGEVAIRATSPAAASVDVISRTSPKKTRRPGTSLELPFLEFIARRPFSERKPSLKRRVYTMTHSRENHARPQPSSYRTVGFTSDRRARLVQSRPAMGKA